MSISRKRLFFVSLFLAILLTSAISKLFFIDRKELWLDETYSWHVISLSFSEMIGFIKGDVHPPLYYILLKTWSMVFGLSPFFLKSFSVVISIVASIFFYFLVLKIIEDRWISLFCFFLFQFSPVLFYYSVEVRMYMLATLFCIISLYYFYDVIHIGKFSFKSISMFSLGCVGLFYTHYVGIFLILGYLTYYLFSPSSMELKRKNICFSALFVILLTSPWYPILYSQRVNQSVHQQSFDKAKEDPETLNYLEKLEEKTYPAKYYRKIFTNDVENIASIFGIYPFKGKYLLYSMNVAFFMIAVYYLFLVWRNDNKSRIIFILLLTYYVVAMFFQIHARRSYILLAPLLLIIIGIVISESYNSDRRKMMSVFLILSVSVLYLAGFVRIYNRNYCNMNTRIVKFLESSYEKNDIVVFNSLYYEVPFDYYSKIYGFRPQKIGFPISIYEWWNKQPFTGWGGPIITTVTLRKFMDNLRKDQHINTIWLILFEHSYYDPKNKLLQGLKEQALSWNAFDLDLALCEGESGGQCSIYRIKLAPTELSTH